MDLYDFKGKTALITGASSGLGKQFAHSLTKYGARVIVAARSKNKLEDLAKELGNAVAVVMDVGDNESVKRAFKELLSKGEKIDICINNAGIAEMTPIFDDNQDAADNFANIIQTNVMGVWYVTKAIANHMKENNIAGSIINIGSVNGANKLREEVTGYCASKAAVMQMTKALVGELAPHNIRINCINPGLHRTPLTQGRIDNTQFKTEIEQLIPLGFIGEPIELEGAILYLSSNKASHYVTGTVITVDGGISWGGS
ncbi:MAG: SDR family oxidoreductase [Rickettsiaceae bacterium]|nr:SDR family oxidoreductase [Rickettsiaceae bacterium]